VAAPVSYLHTIDPRIKQAWLLVLLLLPVRASLEVRELLDGLLVLLAVTSLPRAVWKPQVRSRNSDAEGCER
jgi:energy-coupling factor transport system permease protein